MELLTPLETWLREKKSISYRDVVRLGEDLCDALTDCSRLSIIHRDIKPDNIFVTDDGRFKLGDFGIARRLERGDLNLSQRVGSLGYMSPEVFHAQPYDLRADIYSLGLVLYRLVNGHRAPFTPAPPAANTPDTANKANEIRLSGKPVPRPEEIPGNLERLWEIIRKACEFYPDDRYRTPEEMKKAFRELEPLTDLDQPVALYSRDQSPEKPGGSDTVMPFTSASITGSHRRRIRPYPPFSRQPRAAGIKEERRRQSLRFRRRSLKRRQGRTFPGRRSGSPPLPRWPCSAGSSALFC